ncbi:hypothetical protein [Hymenobacter canadensis]|uniref:PH domain-containing protein n=1 Tax=Hymenobacter canadensis TaxID=2999067 RepID=A0ABY7LV40_9BACT|nr:hypothetical protein [Hymenobacter canadensis]WBA44254.1 hypothetical protein O3303_21500 [Hymenobacter canadensis]
MENESLPPESVIRYSTVNLLSYLVVCVAFVATAVHQLWNVRPLGFGAPFIFLIGLGSFVVIGRQLWLLGNNRPQLTISERGIQLGSAPVDVWKTIRDEEVRKVRLGRGTDTILYYRAGNEVRELNIRELAISASHLTRLLQQYRAQSQALRHQ